MSVNVDFTEHLMEYEIEIIKRLSHKEALLVLANGLSSREIVLSLLKLGCSILSYLSMAATRPYKRVFFKIEHPI